MILISEALIDNEAMSETVLEEIRWLMYHFDFYLLMPTTTRFLGLCL